MWRPLGFLLCGLCLSTGSFAADPVAGNEDQRIEALLAKVGQQPDVQFVRNGSAYDAATAVKFLRGKWDRQRTEIMSTDDIAGVIRDVRAEVVHGIVAQYIPPESVEEQWDVAGLEQAVERDFAVRAGLAAWLGENPDRRGNEAMWFVANLQIKKRLGGIRHGFSEDLAIAGLLHDVVEDTDTSLALITAEFGDDLARLIEAVTETKSADGAALPWEQRKAEKLAHLQAAGPDVAALKAADAIHNLRSISADLRSAGPVVWERFKRGPAPTLGYYHAILDAVRAKLGAHPIVAELADAVAELEEAAGG